MTGECNSFVRNVDLDVDQLAKPQVTAILTGGSPNVTGLNVMDD